MEPINQLNYDSATSELMRELATISQMLQSVGTSEKAMEPIARIGQTAFDRAVESVHEEAE